MAYTLIRGIAGDERLVILSEELFDKIVHLVEQDLGPGNLSDWVNSRANRDALPIALARRVIHGETPHRLYRELRGLSTADLADLTGLSHDYVIGVEAGDAEETLAARRKIAEVLHVRMDDLEPAVDAGR